VIALLTGLVHLALLETARPDDGIGDLVSVTRLRTLILDHNAPCGPMSGHVDCCVRWMPVVAALPVLKLINAPCRAAHHRASFLAGPECCSASMSVASNVVLETPIASLHALVYVLEYECDKDYR
jgi:hypothetical protein